jgi:hypothetical protein
MKSLHGPIDTSEGYRCLVRMRYRLAYKYVAEYAPEHDRGDSETLAPFSFLVDLTLWPGRN